MKQHPAKYLKFQCAVCGLSLLKCSLLNKEILRRCGLYYILFFSNAQYSMQLSAIVCTGADYVTGTDSIVKKKFFFFFNLKLISAHFTPGAYCLPEIIVTCIGKGKNITLDDPASLAKCSTVLHSWSLFNSVPNKWSSLKALEVDLSSLILSIIKGWT